MAPRGRGGYIASMHRTLARALVSATLIAVIGGGGGGLPALDALLYHRSGDAAEALRPHYEATSGCHVDRCLIRSPAQETRYLPAPLPAKLVSLPPEDTASRPSSDSVRPRLLSHPRHSRAPPVPSVG
jgi:hypothetical protein